MANYTKPAHFYIHGLKSKEFFLKEKQMLVNKDIWIVID